MRESSDDGARVGQIRHDSLKTIEQRPFCNNQYRAINARHQCWIVSRMSRIFVELKNLSMPVSTRLTHSSFLTSSSFAAPGHIFPAPADETVATASFSEVANILYITLFATELVNSYETRRRDICVEMCIKTGHRPCNLSWQNTGS
jgi:hypothetical protein